MRIFRRIVTTLLLIAILVCGGFVAWANTPARPGAEAFAALRGTDRVKVSRDAAGRLLFEPVGTHNGVGLVLYPGARIDPRSYAPVAVMIAERGSVVVVPPMLFNLAVLSPAKAADIIAGYQGVRVWVVGGHSLGGAMAARFARLNPKTVTGLVLWAAYPSSTDSLAGSSLAVLSVTGTRDGLATPAKIMAARTLLPASTTYRPIEGGNHAQFGAYGRQMGDNAATIAPQEQWARVAQATADFLALLAAGGS